MRAWASVSLATTAPIVFAVEWVRCPAGRPDTRKSAQPRRWVVTSYLLASTVIGPVYGKLGDLYRRKIVLQTAIVIFLVGSALCGLAQGMFELIAFHAVQGIGGGGLIVTTMAVRGDIVPPRDRGKYQGFFGAVFGVSTVLGPLLGGFFVDNLSWRWIFYVNLPVGGLALVVIGAAFHTRSAHVRH